MKEQSTLESCIHYVRNEMLNIIKESKNLKISNEALKRENAHLKNKLENISSLISNGSDVIADPFNKNNIDETEFNNFWEMYGKKIGRCKCLSKFSKLSKKDIANLFAALPSYVESTPDVVFRKHPITWLNGRHWEDEIYKPNVAHIRKSKDTVVKASKSRSMLLEHREKRDAKCDENRSKLKLTDIELISICNDTRCREKPSQSKLPQASTLHERGYSLGNISSKLFGDTSFLSTKLRKKGGSRYIAFVDRLIHILPIRAYTK